ncbi:thioesterase II family protein [Kutzneria sp. CA-103260]|uniref:thioesterase II family protein n=1 Tax=Kutzneria sp. CA-103260 TaxID=2802641 RepID=UPI001BACFE1E|nr:alpha/beta fold hydrolase [Kutzneria sp. CA-103260]QUQ67507.1 thioesterase [Kutzneria sp. CA-103260]
MSTRLGSARRNTAVIRPKQLDGATTTLVCLGFCGGGTGPYHPWAEVVAPDVDLALICYPGRDGRFREKFATTWDELAEDATRAVVSAVSDQPYVLFGHSMGGWMAFEVASRLEAQGRSVPDALVVSSCNAPARGLTPRDMFPACHDSDDELLSWIRAHGLVTEQVLSDPDVLEMAIEIMRADIAVRDTFHYGGAAGVSMPLQVLSGVDDQVIEATAPAQWRELALGPYRHDSLPGGHFYTPDVWRNLPSHITAIAR